MATLCHNFFCTVPIDWWPGLVHSTMDKGLPYLNYIWIRKRGRDLLLVLLLSILERLLFFSPFFWEEGIARLVLRFVFVPNEFFKSSICWTLGWVQFWKSQYNTADERQILQTIIILCHFIMGGQNGGWCSSRRPLVLVFPGQCLT